MLARKAVTTVCVAATAAFGLLLPSQPGLATPSSSVLTEIGADWVEVPGGTLSDPSVIQFDASAGDVVAISIETPGDSDWITSDLVAPGGGVVANEPMQYTSAFLGPIELTDAGAYSLELSAEFGSDLTVQVTAVRSTIQDTLVAGGSPVALRFAPGEKARLAVELEDGQTVAFSDLEEEADRLDASVVLRDDAGTPVAETSDYFPSWGTYVTPSKQQDPERTGSRSTRMADSGAT